MTEVRVPTLGESVTEATVATWFKKPGDAVAVDEMLCELETDKVTVEVPSPAAGTLSEIVAAEGRNRRRRCAAWRRSAEGSGPRPPRSRKPRRAPAPEARACPNLPQRRGRGGGDEVPVMVPTLGESVTEATVSTWFKAGR